MRIAVLNWRDAAHPDAGGAEVFVHEITRRWAADGHRVSLHSSQWSRGSSHDEIDGVEVVRTGRLRSLGHHIAAPRTVLGYGRPHGIVESINTIPYLMPWRSRGAPFISLVHQLARDVWRSHLPAPAAFAARALERALYMPYRTVPTLAVSESTKADLLSVGLSDVRVIPQGGLGVQPLREKAATPTLVFVGRLASNKRPDHAVEAFREVKRSFPEARFWIVGTGEMSEPLRAALPDGAELLGKLPRTELLDRMGRAHLLLATSVREGWGLVVTEANALGTPCVAYDVPGLRDSVKHGVTGWLTTPDPRSLAGAAKDLIERPELYSKLRAQAIEWGRTCTWDNTAAAVLAELVATIEGRVPSEAR
jgi:glycosyltransferase involved in cell wall biosynthesis